MNRVFSSFTCDVKVCYESMDCGMDAAIQKASIAEKASAEWVAVGGGDRVAGGMGVAANA
jgi:hypothetical protein